MLITSPIAPSITNDEIIPRAVSETNVKSRLLFKFPNSISLLFSIWLMISGIIYGCVTFGPNELNGLIITAGKLCSLCNVKITLSPASLLTA